MKSWCVWCLSELTPHWAFYIRLVALQTAPRVMHCGLRVKETLSDNREVWRYKGIIPGNNSVSHIRCCAKGADVMWQSKEPARQSDHTTGTLQVKNKSNGFFVSVVSEDGGGTRGETFWAFITVEGLSFLDWSCTTYFNYTRKRENDMEPFN